MSSRQTPQRGTNSILVESTNWSDYSIYARTNPLKDTISTLIVSSRSPIKPSAAAHAYGITRRNGSVSTGIRGSWLTQGFRADRSRGGAQFLIQCGQWQRSALREFQIGRVIK